MKEKEVKINYKIEPTKPVVIEEKLPNELLKTIKKGFINKLANIIVVSSISLLSFFVGTIVTAAPGLITLNQRVAALEQQYMEFSKQVVGIISDLKEVKDGLVDVKEQNQYIINRLDNYFNRSN